MDCKRSALLTYLWSICSGFATCELYSSASHFYYKCEEQHGVDWLPLCPTTAAIFGDWLDRAVCKWLHISLLERGGLGELEGQGSVAMYQ